MIFAAVDWAEERHYVVLLDEQGEILHNDWIGHDSWQLAHLDSLLTRRQRDQEVHVAIELHDSLLLDRLLRLDVHVYGINPKSAERARERFTPAGIKDDERDAWSLAEFLRTSYQHLRPLKPHSEATLALREWVALREDLLQDRTVEIQRLRDHLVRWHPQLLGSISDLHRDWVLDFLDAYPTADAFAALTYKDVVQWTAGRRLRLVTVDRLANAAVAPAPTVQPARNAAHAAEVRHRVQAIRMLNQRLTEIDQALAALVEHHPDAAIFRSLPYCGKVTAASLLAGFGEDRAHWDGHEHVAALWGVAPITLQSGKHRTVRFRRACDKTLHQTWIWFAFNTTRKQGCWAREAYQAKRRAGVEHYTALRAIADTWVKIAYRCWMDRKPYDEVFHQARRAQRQQPRMTR